MIIFMLLVLALIGVGIWAAGGFTYARSLIDTQRITGRYERPIGPGSIEFRRDGTVLEIAPLISNKGTFKMLPNERIEIEMEGMLWGTNRAVFGWGLVGSQLCLKPDGAETYLYRLKSLD